MAIDAAGGELVWFIGVLALAITKVGAGRMQADAGRGANRSWFMGTIQVVFHHSCPV
jgi:hypothetical protein